VSLFSICRSLLSYVQVSFASYKGHFSNFIYTCFMVSSDSHVSLFLICRSLLTHTQVTFDSHIGLFCATCSSLLTHTQVSFDSHISLFWRIQESLLPHTEVSFDSYKNRFWIIQRSLWIIQRSPLTHTKVSLLTSYSHVSTGVKVSLLDSLLRTWWTYFLLTLFCIWKIKFFPKNQKKSYFLKINLKHCV